MKRLNDLPTAHVWKIFQEISRIPRASGNEENIGKWLHSFAQKQGLKSRIDDTGNVIVRADATPGMEKRPALAFQGHMDMVAAKEPESSHDFSRDPIIPRVIEIKDEAFVTATDTTLGADDGIGIAIALAIMTDPDLEHGPLEALFTVGEEVSMIGINGFAPGILESKYMINIDSETDDEVTVGCAGGTDAEFRFPLVYEPESCPCGLKIMLSGFTGGHSGMEIHKKRANAIQTLAMLLKELLSSCEVKLSSINGGSFRNAIPVGAGAVLGGTAEEIARARTVTSDLIQQIADQYKSTDPGIKLATEIISETPAVSKDDSKDIIATLCEMPDGVLTMSSRFSGVVETSLNLGVITTCDKEIVTSSLLRSLNDTAAMENILQEVANRHKTQVRFFNRYPGWDPSPDSKLLNAYAKVYTDFNFKKPKVAVIHAGVECGILRGKYPDLDIISIGPNISGAHTTTERVSVPSVEKIYGMILTVMEELTE